MGPRDIFDESGEYNTDVDAVGATRQVLRAYDIITETGVGVVDMTDALCERLPHVHRRFVRDVLICNGRRWS